MPPACSRDCRQSPRFSPVPYHCIWRWDIRLLSWHGQAGGVWVCRSLWQSVFFHEEQRQPSWCPRLPSLVFKKTGKELERENKNDRFNDDRRVRKRETRRHTAFWIWVLSSPLRTRVLGAGCRSLLTSFLLCKIICVAFRVWQIQASTEEAVQERNETRWEGTRAWHAARHILNEWALFKNCHYYSVTSVRRLYKNTPIFRGKKKHAFVLLLAWRRGIMPPHVRRSSMIV